MKEKRTEIVCQVQQEHLPKDTKTTHYVWCSCRLVCNILHDQTIPNL